MNIMEVAAALRGAPHLIAARPRGIVIRRTDRGLYLKVSEKSGKEYPYHPCGLDLEAIDWGVFTVPQYRKIIMEQAAAAAQANAEGAQLGEAST